MSNAPCDPLSEMIKCTLRCNTMTEIDFSLSNFINYLSVDATGIVLSGSLKKIINSVKFLRIPEH